LVGLRGFEDRIGSRGPLEEKEVLEALDEAWLSVIGYASRYFRKPPTAVP